MSDESGSQPIQFKFHLDHLPTCTSTPPIEFRHICKILANSVIGGEADPTEEEIDTFSDHVDSCPRCQDIVKQFCDFGDYLKISKDMAEINQAAAEAGFPPIVEETSIDGVPYFSLNPQYEVKLAPE